MMKPYYTNDLVTIYHADIGVERPNCPANAIIGMDITKRTLTKTNLSLQSNSITLRSI